MRRGLNQISEGMSCWIFFALCIHELFVASRSFIGTTTSPLLHFSPIRVHSTYAPPTLEL
jgi:hypothetical protein